MAQQIITRLLCDYCLADDIETTEDVVNEPVTVLGVEYETDVCKSHREPIAALAALLDEHARRVGGRRRPNGSAAALPTAPSERMACPSCGRTYRGRGSLAGHVRTEHGASLAELEGLPLPYSCDVCGRNFAKPQGLGAHKRFHAHPA